jgi:hypothetical protein
VALAADGAVCQLLMTAAWEASKHRDVTKLGVHCQLP